MNLSKIDDATVDILDDGLFKVTYTAEGKSVGTMIMSLEQVEELQLAMIDAVVRKREEVHNKPIINKK